MLDLTDFGALQFREEDFRNAPAVDIEGMPILDTMPEKWEHLMRLNPKARELWETTDKYGCRSTHAFALMNVAGWFGLTKSEAAALNVAHYARHGDKEKGIRSVEYNLRAWEKGRKRAEAWEASSNGQPIEREPGEPLPGEVAQGNLASETTTLTKPEKKTTSLPPVVIPARDFLKRSRGEQAKLIPRLGGRRGGKLGLYGPGGAGKSYSSLNIALDAARGNPLLDYAEWVVTSPLRVAFISLEDPATEQLDRLGRLLGSLESPENLFIFDRDLEEEGFILAGGRRGELNERAFRRLDACLGDLKIDLLLIEPKRYLVDVDENSSTENMPWQRRLQDLLIRHGTLILIGHHAGWDRDGKIHARGTTVFRDWVDGMIQQTEDQIQGKPGFLLTCNKSNFAARWNPLSVLFDPETGKMQAVDETTGKLPPALLRACFEEHSGSIQASVREVYEAVAQYASCSEATARRGIESAVKAKWLRSLGRGKGFELCGSISTGEGT